MKAWVYKCKKHKYNNNIYLYFFHIVNVWGHQGHLSKWKLICEIRATTSKHHDAVCQRVHRELTIQSLTKNQAKALGLKLLKGMWRLKKWFVEAIHPHTITTMYQKTKNTKLDELIWNTSFKCFWFWLKTLSSEICFAFNWNCVLGS